ncbi:NAD-dependent deacetylase [Melghirimyces profundicolus]|uniref:protein acetyllysine N-acetyltransferase n=1 Tax=Melghirimyces profundicolus TaxID=1242148 RepID=A0A2T6BW30_9BACL|nr:NAD-dependent deacylase [Melghirimyces profundicolus]PTX60275.1 NAD-dependent deacetylase [Melghirimyces profundicolus]
MTDNGKLKRLLAWLEESRCTSVLTGAGMSTESGIPDFRSREGFWRNLDPRTVATVDAMKHHYDEFHRFYSARIRALRKVRPHRGHDVLASWERQGRVHAVATQNVERLHQEAGSRNVYELHGSILDFRCARCGEDAEREEFLRRSPCPSCGGPLRPGIVLFGEILPERAWENAFQSMERSDLVLVIGTRLEVSPVNRLPMVSGGKKVLINAQPTEMDHDFDLVIRGKAGELLHQLETMRKS